MKRMWDDSEIVKIAKESVEVTPEALTKAMEGGVGVSVDLNEANDKVSVGIDLTGGVAGDVLTINDAGTGVAWAAGVGGGSGMTKELLWTNANPSSNFAAQTLTIVGLSGYKYVTINFRILGAQSSYCTKILDLANSGDQYRVSEFFTDSVCQRFVTPRAGDNQLQFSGGWLGTVKQLAEFEGSGLSDNAKSMIPFQIYGIK